MSSLNLLSTVATDAASGALDAGTLEVITQGFTTLGATVGQILAIAIPAAVGVIGLNAGSRFALKKIKGLLASAS